MKIKSIKKIKPRIVYAIKTSSGTFIADGLAHHNCAPCNYTHQFNILPYTITIGEERIQYLNYVYLKYKNESMTTSQKRLLLVDLLRMIDEIPH